MTNDEHAIESQSCMSFLRHSTFKFRHYLDKGKVYLMRNRWQRWGCMVLMSSIGGLIMANGCLINVQRELDLLWAPDANIDYARQSWLVKTFGPGILNFW